MGTPPLLGLSELNALSPRKSFGRSGCLLNAPAATSNSEVYEFSITSVM